MLDPFIGSGSTAVATHVELSRQYVGIDTNTEFVELSRQRIDAKLSVKIPSLGRKAREQYEVAMF